MPPQTRTRRQRIVLFWFALDAVVAMLPPLYWLADGRTSPILGVPGALFYFLAVSTFIKTSLIVAHLAGPEDDL